MTSSELVQNRFYSHFAGWKRIHNKYSLKIRDWWNYLMINSLINSVYFYFPGSADEDSGVGGSPGSSSRAAALHNCSMCSKKFSRADILRKHLKTHVNSSCTVCGQIFNDKVALAKHQVEVGQLSLSNFATRLCPVGWIRPWIRSRRFTMILKLIQGIYIIQMDRFCANIFWYQLPQTTYESSKIAIFWLSKSIFYVKNYQNLSNFFFHWRISF